MQSKNVVRLSAAGSGKTWGISHDALALVPHIESRKKVLLTTYTNKGIDSIVREIENQNRGVPSAVVDVQSWYTFLLHDLIRPYQSCIAGINEIRSFDFTKQYGRINYVRRGEKRRYVNSHGDVLANFASELAVVLNSLSNGAVIKRIEELYSHIFIDEVQDLAGDDLEIIGLLFDSEVAVTCAGDGKQATYATHNTQKGKRHSGKNVWAFFEEADRKQRADVEYCLESRRFNERICRFANTVFPNGNNITTSMKEETDHDGVFLVRREDVPMYYRHFRPVVLRYDIKTVTDGYPSLNFGQCKGLTFDRVLIYPNGPFRNFVEGVPLQAQEKYYVAVTRPKYSIAIVVDKFPDNPSYQDETIEVCKTKIRSQRFVIGEA